MWCLVFSVGSCVSCAEFMLGCVSATGLRDELPVFRAGCRPVQLLVYHRASSDLCQRSLAAGSHQGKAAHPTLRGTEGWRIWPWAVSSCWCVFRPRAVASASTLVQFESPAKLCALSCCSCVTPCPEVFTVSVETGPSRRAWNAEEVKKDGGVEGKKVWGCTEGSRWHGTLKSHQQNTTNWTDKTPGKKPNNSPAYWFCMTNPSINEWFLK